MVDLFHERQDNQERREEHQISPPNVTLLAPAEWRCQLGGSTISTWASTDKHKAMVTI